MTPYIRAARVVSGTKDVNNLKRSARINLFDFAGAQKLSPHRVPNELGGRCLGE